MTLSPSFWAKAGPTDCIVWSGAHNTLGYGCFWIAGTVYLSHRLAWEDRNGPIPEGMTIDHLCRVRACVNVQHMELVSIAENVRRQPRVLKVGGECRNGHRIAVEADLYTRSRSGRLIKECRFCKREQVNRSRATASAGAA